MRRILKGLLILLLVGVLAVLVWAGVALYGSRPQLEGTLQLAGLEQEVTVERDEEGVPRIHANSRLDAIRALGFVHAQDRFFQMDLLRRTAAGELAELFGPFAVETDRGVRVHRLRSRAQRILAASSNSDRTELESYAAAVNAGLQATGRPPEYRLLRSSPVPWRAEDSILCVFAMYLSLQDANGRLDAARGLMRDTFSAEMLAFLLPDGSEWDAPLQGDAFETPPIPQTWTWPRRRATATQEVAWRQTPDELETAAVLGSNNWAVAGSRTADGRALVANDMHLGHSLPNIWYRAALHWTSEDGKQRRATGVTLPGVAGIVAGSTEHVAWGFTNSQGDWSDRVELELLPQSKERYQTPTGVQTIETVDETIRVHNAADVTLTVRETIWGPIVDKSARGIPHVARWVAHDTRAVNLNLSRMADAETLEQALHLAQTTGMPAQNIVVAAADGRIGWTLTGPIPNRRGYDGRYPVSWADGTRGWDGWLSPERVPTIVDPADGILWSANNRTLDGEALAAIGFGGYAGGARARQIRDRLLELHAATPQDLLEIQLDDRALFLARWHERLRSLLSRQLKTKPNADWETLAHQLETTWTGHASIDSVAYRMVRGWRHAVARRVFEPLTAECRGADERFNYLNVGRWEGPLWSLLQAEPAHLLAPEYADWDALQLAAVDELLDNFRNDKGLVLDAFTWGDRNQVVMAHPLSAALPPFLARRINIPTEALPGDNGMPRVQGRGYGSSERFVVSPGDEANGLFHMPGGQSGHFESPSYRAGHRAWATGGATPFLPGATKHRLRLEPAD